MRSSRPACRKHGSRSEQHREQQSQKKNSTAPRERLLWPREEQRMDNVTLIGILMTILSVIVYIGYKKGWIK